MTDKNKKRIILAVNSSKEPTIAAGRGLLRWLESRVDVVAHNLDAQLDWQQIPEADYAIVVGGDGTILSTVRAMGQRQLPLVGVNMGKLGFLAEFSMEELQGQFESIVEGAVGLSKRMMLHCRITGPGRSEFSSMVVNELAVTAGPPFRMIELSIRIADEQLAFCAGDGLIVATPTGSTAYNLSAGGPILSSHMEAAVITPLAAHSLNFRPVVVDLSRPIILGWHEGHLPSMDESGEKRNDPAAVVVIDGQCHTPLHCQDEIVITKHEQRFLLASNPGQSQWRLLNMKLNWGSLPNYNQHRKIMNSE